MDQLALHLRSSRYQPQLQAQLQRRCQAAGLQVQLELHTPWVVDGEYSYLLLMQAEPGQLPSARAAISQQPGLRVAHAL